MGKRSGMAARTRRELRKLRELVRFLLAGRTCCFCGEALVTGDATYGTADGPVLKVPVTLHHKDEDRSHNQEENLSLSHTTCHKRHHATEQAAKRRQEAEEKARYLVGLVQGTMALEAQGLGQDVLDEMVRETTESILAKPVKLFDQIRFAGLSRGKYDSLQMYLTDGYLMYLNGNEVCVRR